jgi:hypothetical protein
MVKVRLLLIAVLIVVSIGAVWIARRNASPGGVETRRGQAPAAASRVAEPSTPRIASTQGESSAPATPANAAPSSQQSPAPPQPSRVQIRTEIEEVATTIRDFRNALNGNPVGTNAEITAALLGQNERQVNFPIPTGSSVNAKGELCDHWGTPYFFHQLSSDRMEVRSAGPDKVMWSADDVQM